MLLYTDGFDLDDYLSRWTVPAGSNGGNTAHVAPTADGRFGSRGLAFSANTANQLARAIPNTTTITVGCAFKSATWSPSFYLPIVTLWGDSGATEHLYIGFLSDGRIGVKRGQWNGTHLGDSGAGVFALNTWYFVEVTAVIADGTGGSVQVKIGTGDTTTTVVNLTGIDTRNGGTVAGVDSVRIGSQAIFVAGTMTYDDLYILDAADGTASQGAPLNAPLGPCKIKTLLPSGAGSETDFVPTGSSSNFENVNDSPLVESTYNAGSAVGDRDLYALPDPALASATVHAVVANLHALRDNTGAISLKAAVKSGGSLGYGSPVALGTTRAHVQSVIGKDPSTSAPFTAAALDAMEIGAEVA